GNFPQIGQPIPYIGIRITDPGDASKPGAASCEGSSLSDSQGQAHCNLRIGCQTGNFGLSAVVGEYRAFPLFLTVNRGGVSQIVMTGGNNQSARSGQLTANTLSANIKDGCGSSVPGAAAVWKVTQGSATLEQTLTNADSNGFVSTKVRMGNTPGPVTVEVSISNGQKVTFSLTNQVVVAGITLVSGGGQEAQFNQTFANPVVFRVADVNNNPIVGATVTFSAGLGGTAIPNSVATDAN